MCSIIKSNRNNKICTDLCSQNDEYDNSEVFMNM